jgi:hypothetical protein
LLIVFSAGDSRGDPRKFRGGIIPPLKEIHDFLTLEACMPFCPLTTSKVTFCPSSRDRNPCSLIEV